MVASKRKAFVPIGNGDIRLAMIGKVEENGHPYSWSAIFNGYDPAQMARSPYPIIADYLNKQPEETLQIPGAKVTHIWTDRPLDAINIASTCRIPHIVSRPEDVIGEVDAVLIATDIGSEHVERCRPFVEAGVPIFVDKPLVDNERDLRQFSEWVSGGSPIMSCSCMRYAKEFMPYRQSIRNIGELKYASISMAKSWERYGIHAIEAVYPIIGPGFVSARHIGDERNNMVLYRHRSGVFVMVIVSMDLYGAFGVLELYGTADHVHAVFKDRYYAFRAQLEQFVAFLRTGEPPFPFAETEEMMRMLIAGIVSREQGGREVRLEEIGR